MAGQRGKEFRNGENVMVFIPICFMFANGKIFISATLMDLCFADALYFTLCESDNGAAGEVTLIQTH